MVPANQCFGAHDARLGEVDDGLVVELELVAPLGLPQLGRECKLDARIALWRLVQAVPVTATVLGGVHGDICVLEQGFGAVAVGWKEAGADAGGDAHVGARDRERRLEGVDKFGGNACRDRRGAGGTAPRLELEVEVGQQNQELITALARNHIGRPHSAAQSQGDCTQKLVARTVAKTVIDELEVVEIEEEHGDTAPGPLGSCDRNLQMLAEHRPVGKTGQRIVVGQVCETILGLFARRNVEQIPLPVERRALRTLDDHRLVTQPPLAAVWTHNPILTAEVAVAIMRGGQCSHHPVAIPRMNDLGEQVRISHPLLMGVARDLGVLGTVVDRRSLCIECIDIDRQREPLDQVSITLLRFAEMYLRILKRLLGEFVLGDIEDHSVDGRRLTVLVA